MTTRPERILASSLRLMHAPRRMDDQRALTAVIAVVLLLDVALVVTVFSRLDDGLAPDVSGGADGLGAQVATTTNPRHKPTPTPAQTPTNLGGTPPEPRQNIELEERFYTAQPTETLKIAGRYSRSEVPALLRVQRKQQDAWASFPLPTRTDRSGNFSAYVELGKPGRHRLRVVDPQTGAASSVITVAIR